MTFTARHESVSINRPAGEVYEYISNPENLPKWASGLSGAIENVDGDWVAESPFGRVKVKFAPRNQFGVLDHDVTVESGETFYNPMRVYPNDDGCEVVFTVYQRAAISDEAFEEDARTVLKDMQTLKSLMEN